MSCSRAWEVEAARDGRLGERERKAHLRHLGDCVDCRREQRELDELHAGLRAVADCEMDGPELRHGRQLLLERARAERHQRALPSPGSRRPLVLALVAAALGIIAFWLGFHRTSSTAIVVRATPGTSYRRYDDGGRHFLQLRSGRLEIEVQHADGEPRLRVLTPDGVLDDLGTTFVVEVAQARTQRVEVSVGLVRVAIVGRPVAMVEPGQVYRPYPSDAVAVLAPDTSSVPSRDLLRDTEPDVVAQLGAPPMPPMPVEMASTDAGPKVLPKSAHRKPPPNARSVARDSAAGDDGSLAARAFSEAVQTLDRGEAVDAARRFRAFAQTYPTDRRAEDAGYLRVVSWLRAGKRAEARSAAEEFLRRYPEGFRRQDVERLLAH